MYHIKTDQIDLMVTPNHRMWVSKQDNTNRWLEHDFELAENIIGKRRRYKKNVEWNVNDYQFILPSIKCKIIFFIKKKYLIWIHG